MSNSLLKKVVGLDSYSQPRGSASDTAGARVLREAGRLASQRLKGLVDRMMDKVNDALFERAEKAESSALQSRYLDAITELRRIRGDVEDNFIAALVAGIADGVPRSSLERGVESAFYTGGYGSHLAGRPDMEEELAIAGLVGRMRDLCPQSLPLLDRRVGFLIGDPRLERWLNPFGPEAVCNAFWSAARHIDAGLEIRLVILKLFDSCVCAETDNLYQEVNHYFVRMGVLPDLQLIAHGFALDMAAVHTLYRETQAPTARDAANADLVPMAAGIQPCYRDMVQVPDARSVAMAKGITPCDKNRRQFPAADSVPMAPGIEPSRVHAPVPAPADAVSVRATPQVKPPTKDHYPHKAVQPADPPVRGPICRVQHGVDAKAIPDEDIQPCIEDTADLQFVRAFIARHWKNLLFVICARHGSDSAPWQQTLDTMDELIWSVKPKSTAEERRRLATLQPVLLQKLRRGMERLSIPAAEQEDFIAKLVRAHAAATAHDDAHLFTAAAPSESAGAGQPVGSAGPRGDVRAESPVHERLTAPQEDPRSQVQRLKPGDWLEFRDSDNTARRAKLSWVSPITGTLLFTDRHGLHAGNYSVEDLADLLRCSRARILDRGPLVDRAVGSMLEQCRAH